LLKSMSEIADEQKAALYIVGGFVRDMILERPCQDLDLVVEGDAVTLARGLQERYGGRVTTHTRFGTAKWMISDIRADLAIALKVPEGMDDLPELLDFISARTEFYAHPTALPTVERGSIKLDLHRRDFTINTLALRLDGKHYGELHDYWGGINDLRAKLVRVLHPLSFVDDPTRMLRAARFEQMLDFHIEKRTLELLVEARSLIGQVSGDRIRHELDHILDMPHRINILERLSKLGLLTEIHPTLEWDEISQENLEMLNLIPVKILDGIKLDLFQENNLRQLAYILWFIHLPVEKLQPILKRFRYPATQVKNILSANRLWKDLPWIANAKLSSIANRLEDVPDIALYANFLAAHDEGVCSNLQAYLRRLSSIDPKVNGNELRKRGLPPGPEYKRILSAIRDAWLDGKIKTEEQELAYLNELISDDPGLYPSS
jgi:tRNA nucleotidyltransferase (CCA-adding enzyme)